MTNTAVISAAIFGALFGASIMGLAYEVAHIVRLLKRAKKLQLQRAGLRTNREAERRDVRPA